MAAHPRRIQQLSSISVGAALYFANSYPRVFSAIELLEATPIPWAHPGGF